MLVRFMNYDDGTIPSSYTAPPFTPIIQPTYDFIRSHLSTRLKGMIPVDLVNSPLSNWCLADAGETYLVYALSGGTISLTLSGAAGKNFRAQWFDPRTGSLSNANGGIVQGGATVDFTAPDSSDWGLYLVACLSTDADCDGEQPPPPPPPEERPPGESPPEESPSSPTEEGAESNDTARTCGAGLWGPMLFTAAVISFVRHRRRYS